MSALLEFSSASPMTCRLRNKKGWSSFSLFGMAVIRYLVGPYISCYKPLTISPCSFKRCGIQYWAIFLEDDDRNQMCLWLSHKLATISSPNHSKLVDEGLVILLKEMILLYSRASLFVCFGFLP